MRKSCAAIAAPKPGAPVGEPDGKITAGSLYPRWQQMLKAQDIVFAETGTSSMGMAEALLPAGAVFHNQTLWGSIAGPRRLPAALGCEGWLTARVTTCGELDRAIAQAEAADAAAYIEVVTDRYEASLLARRLHEAVATLYA